jgi:hypothetical protein
MAAGLASVLAQPATVRLPLYHVLDNSGDHRLGLYAALGGSPEFKLYELDTGSTGLYAAHNEKWWPREEFVKKGTGTQSYGSGVSFHYDIVRTSVDFGHGAKADPVHIGRITSASGPHFTPAQWDALVAEDSPPLHGVFFGNMGSGLDNKNGLFAVIPQLPGNLSSGFVVETRGLVLQGREGVFVQQGSILIGLTDEIRKRFEIQIPMQQLMSGNKKVLLPSGDDARKEYPIDISAMLSLPGQKPHQMSVPGLLDTGAPSTTIYQDTKHPVPPIYVDGDRVRSGVQFSEVADGNKNWKWGFKTGKTTSINRIAIGSKSKSEINLGTAAFFQYDVMYDLRRGILGLHRIPTGPRIFVRGGTRRSTTKSTFAISGAASSPAGIRKVRYRLNGSPHWRKAYGTATWNADVALQPGANIIRIYALNRNGQSSQQKISVFRQ